VYERESDELDGREIQAIGSVLSKELACPVLAALVADDDVLCLGLFIGGELQVDYSSRGSTCGAPAICRAFRRPWVTPAMWLLLQWPWFVFECFRHILVAKLLGIPSM